MQLLLNCLFASVGRVPPILKAIFAQIRENARDHFFKEGVVGEKREEVEMVQFSSVSSFFFLRLVCPALLSPVQFGLAERYPTEKVGRSLMLIAKILQNLANLAEFGDKVSGGKKIRTNWFALILWNFFNFFFSPLRNPSWPLLTHFFWPISHE